MRDPSNPPSSPRHEPRITKTLRMEGLGPEKDYLRVHSIEFDPNRNNLGDVVYKNIIREVRNIARLHRRIGLIRVRRDEWDALCCHLGLDQVEPFHLVAGIPAAVRTTKPHLSVEFEYVVDSNYFHPTREIGHPLSEAIRMEYLRGDEYALYNAEGEHLCDVPGMTLVKMMDP